MYRIVRLEVSVTHGIVRESVRYMDGIDRRSVDTCLRQTWIQCKTDVPTVMYSDSPSRCVGSVV